MCLGSRMPVLVVISERRKALILKSSYCIGSWYEFRTETFGSDEFANVYTVIEFQKRVSFIILATKFEYLSLFIVSSCILYMLQDNLLNIFILIVNQVCSTLDLLTPAFFFVLGKSPYSQISTATCL